MGRSIAINVEKRETGGDPEERAQAQLRPRTLSQGGDPHQVIVGLEIDTQDADQFPGGIAEGRITTDKHSPLIAVGFGIGLGRTGGERPAERGSRLRVGLHDVGFVVDAVAVGVPGRRRVEDEPWAVRREDGGVNVFVFLALAVGPGQAQDTLHRPDGLRIGGGRLLRGVGKRAVGVTVDALGNHGGGASQVVVHLALQRLRRLPIIHARADHDGEKHHPPGNHAARAGAGEER